MMFGIYFLLCTSLCIISVIGEEKNLTKLFLEATPIHPTFRPPAIWSAETTQSKFIINEPFGSSFAPLSECSGNKTDLKLGDFGYITSPNYPRNYPARLSCEWMIEGPPGTRITAVLTDAVTQAWFFTYFDYVMIAKNGNFSTVDRLSGDMNSKTPMLIQSEENKLGIRFRSSTFFNFRGFKIQYLVVPGNEPVPNFEKPVYDGVCGHTAARPDIGSTTQKPLDSSTATEADSSSPIVVDESTPEQVIPIEEIATESPSSTDSTGASSEIPILNPSILHRSGVKPDPAIVGGSEALKYAYPWMVAILIDERHFCGGSLIDDQHVLTAAHCTDRANMITMLLGSHNIKDGKATEDGRRVFNITKENIFQHPEYNGNTISYDISILRLPQKINFTDRIRPICLPNRYHIAKFYADAPTIVSGWGKPFDNSAGVSPFLKEADVKVMPNNQCRVAFRGIVTGNLICISTTPKSSPCKGDSGGPLMIKQENDLGEQYYMQLGIVSFGSLTCERGLPVGFTRVTAFLDYINEITGKNY